MRIGDVSAGCGTHARPATAASLGLDSRLREQPIDGGGAHLQKEAMELFPIINDPMGDGRWQKQWDHLLWALRAEPVRQIPQSHEGLTHIWTVGGATASAAPSRDRFPAQEPDRMLPMMAEWQRRVSQASSAVTVPISSSSGI